jgi:hypothetical protein
VKSLRSHRRHPPDGTSDIIGDKQRAGPINNDPDGPSESLVIVLRKPRKTSAGFPAGRQLANGTKALCIRVDVRLWQLAAIDASLRQRHPFYYA